MTPAVRARFDDVVAAEQALVADALQQLGPEGAAGVDTNTVEGVAELRSRLGERRFVFSDIGTTFGDRSHLIGTEAMPGIANQQLADLSGMDEWYRRVTGLELVADGDAVEVRTDVAANVANATADYRNRTVSLHEGPRSKAVTAAIIELFPDRAQTNLRRNATAIARHRVAVETHEGGHVVMRRVWGNASAPTAESIIDHLRVEEVLSDLFAAARTGKPTVGVRNLKTLDARWATLDALRATEKELLGNQLDSHQGTQLLTGPMIAVLDALGGDELGAITGSAIRGIAERPGREVIELPSGKITMDTVDVTTAAAALLDATAAHPRATPQLVQGLEDAWRALRVLR